jgi:hypothetical protein
VFGTGLLGLCAGLALGLGTRALAERPSAARLAEALNGRLLTNPTGARFDVTAFDLKAEPAATRLAAHIRLDWAPGMRTRHIEGSGANADAAWAALLDAAVAEFAGTVPGFAAPGALA